MRSTSSSCFYLPQQPFPSNSGLDFLHTNIIGGAAEIHVERVLLFRSFPYHRPLHSFIRRGLNYDFKLLSAPLFLSICFLPTKNVSLY